MRYRFTDTEIKRLLGSMVVLIDTRENDNTHICRYFDQKKIPYESKKLNYGDYSVRLCKNEELGVNRDIFFDNSAIVDAIRGLRQDITNLQLVVGQKTFGRAVVNYSGKRMNGYIGEAEDKLSAGYGWG